MKAAARTTFLLFSIVTLVPANLSAADFTGHDMVIPIVARTPGANGSEWRTDLVLSNQAQLSADVRLILLRNGVPTEVSLALAPRETVVLADLLSETFDLEQASGMLRIEVQNESGPASVAARARIYSVTPGQSEFGQVIQAQNVLSLPIGSVLSGLSNVAGDRTNAGIANPWAENATVNVEMYDEHGNEVGADFWTVIAPGSHIQMNDVIGRFSAVPLENAMLRIYGDPVYAYASVLRGDGGDADFLIATELRAQIMSLVSEPECEQAAPLHLPSSLDGATHDRRWIVSMASGNDPFTWLIDLSQRYRLRNAQLFESSGTFVALIDPDSVSQLRCEPSVAAVQLNVRY